MLRRPRIWLAIFVWLGLNGCATLPYHYGSFHSPSETPPTEVAFEYGRPVKSLDNIAWFTGIWSRILTQNPNVNSHELSEKTREKLIVYMEDNDLTDVLVRVNQYDPKGEWRRLKQNHRVGPGWRYTIGVIGLVHYTVLPGRVFGGDEYNPYTNTLYINSDVPAVALHEAAYAKDIHSRSMPGGYAFINELPIVSFWRRTIAVNDVLGYAQTNDDWLIEHETYRVVYPQMGAQSTVLAGPFLPFWDGLILAAGGAAAGHATGHVTILQRNKERKLVEEDATLDPETPPASEPLVADQFKKPSSKGDIQFTNHETEQPDDGPP